ncbi:MAG: hypothetical protein M3247_08495 [Thermoproteota archaeon]|nr:hypothetical protein [Thermoproteota archaeon]
MENNRRSLHLKSKCERRAMSDDVEEMAEEEDLEFKDELELRDYNDEKD